MVLITFMVYVFVRIGWNPEASYARNNTRVTPAKIQQYKNANFLYDGAWGYVRGYFRWLWQFAHGPDEWQRTIKGRSLVWPELRGAIFNTLRLAGVAAVLGISLGLSLGTLAARKPGGIFDTVVNMLAYFAGAIPPFVSGVVLQLVFAVELGWLPDGRVYPPGNRGFDLWLMTKHLILPVTAVAIQTISGYARFMRASLLDVRSMDYVRTARAKGLTEWQILRRHGVRNAMIPMATVIGLDLGQLIGGLIITENIFNYPGTGKYFIKHATSGDLPALMPFLVLLIISVLVFNLLADLSYAKLDPRIRLA
ncbi:MAG: ABC transporter permease [Actinomycetota bacterium]|nr:ABC transporter permease [Actinomycetota bacterium]